MGIVILYMFNPHSLVSIRLSKLRSYLLYLRHVQSSPIPTSMVLFTVRFRCQTASYLRSSADLESTRLHMVCNGLDRTYR